MTVKEDNELMVRVKARGLELSGIGEYIDEITNIKFTYVLDPIQPKLKFLVYRINP